MWHLEPARLKTFRVVAEQLSFTHAAERLFLTQPAVTLQIKALEEELGLRLFDRTGQQIAPYARRATAAQVCCPAR